MSDPATRDFKEHCEPLRFISADKILLCKEWANVRFRPIADIRLESDGVPMRAELRSLTSLDVDLRTYVPEQEAFCVTVTAQIGAVGEAGADNFDFDVCSTQWLNVELETDRVVSGRFKLIMAEFDAGALEAYVTKRVRQAEGPDWKSVAEKLSRWSHWEFEDYQP